jgi:uncharacterized DUF497 family protein
MDYAQDPIKARMNLRDHGVSFKEAFEAYQDKRLLIIDAEDVDIILDGEYILNADGTYRTETRYTFVGKSITRALYLTVTYVNRKHFGKVIPRFISARKSESYESDEYDKRFIGRLQP